MAMPFLDHKENGMNLEKMEKKPNLDSFWTFMVFIIMYISAFFIFNLSPSTLVCTTKFWFIISNTLIFIILADYGAFSSSQTKTTLHQYHTIKSKPSTLPYFEYEKSRRSTNHHADQHPPEKIIAVVPSDGDRNVTAVDPPKQEDPQLYMTDQENGNGDDGEAGKEDKEFDDDSSSIQEEEEDSDEDEEEDDDDDDDDEEEEEEEEEDSDEDEEEEEEEEDEFSRMSDEEVNKRVEEFIRRFNTQIRLQALKN